MATLEKFEFVKFGPFKFVGKSVYARSGPQYSGFIFGGLWCSFDKISNELDKLSGYATAEQNAVALLTWDKYDDEKQLLGYTVGKFMKADCPVPDGLDFFDIPEMVVAKSLIKGEFNDMISSTCTLSHEALGKQEKFTTHCEGGGFYFEAEVYTNDTIPEDGISSSMEYYISCKEKV